MASVNQAAAPMQQQSLQTMAAKSSWISGFEYDPQNLRLTTHLKNGAIYQHGFVTPLDWQMLQTSQHHARHWSSQIKSKKMPIPVKRVRGPHAVKKEMKNG